MDGFKVTVVWCSLLDMNIYASYCDFLSFIGSEMQMLKSIRFVNTTKYMYLSATLWRSSKWEFVGKLVIWYFFTNLTLPGRCRKTLFHKIFANSCIRLNQIERGLQPLKWWYIWCRFLTKYLKKYCFYRI